MCMFCGPGSVYGNEIKVSKSGRFNLGVGIRGCLYNRVFGGLLRNSRYEGMIYSNNMYFMYF